MGSHAAQLGPTAGTLHMCKHARHAAVVEGIAKQQVLAFNKGDLQQAERWWVPAAPMGTARPSSLSHPVLLCCYVHVGA